MTNEAPTGTVEGVVVNVKAVSPKDVTGFSVRAASGQVFEFDLARLENPAAFPPEHLREHLADGYPVVVRFVEESGTRYALELDDGTPPARGG